jgi:hypothetical protein
MAFNPYLTRVLPNSDIRKLSGKFETAKQMQAERKIRIAALEKAQGSECLSLANVLKKCAKGNRCRNAASPICSRRYRIWLVGEALRLIGDESNLKLVTLIDVDDAITAETLHNLNPRTLVNRFRQQLRRGDIQGPIIGGIDGEYDEDRELYQPHFHLICLESQSAEIQQLAARHYPRGDAVYRGCMVNPIKENLADTIAYTIKGYWLQKSRYIGNRRRNSKRLDPKLHMEWLVWRSQFSLGEFSVFYQLRRYGGELVVIDKS